MSTWWLSSDGEVWHPPSTSDFATREQAIACVLDEFPWLKPGDKFYTSRAVKLDRHDGIGPIDVDRLVEDMAENLDLDHDGVRAEQLLDSISDEDCARLEELLQEALDRWLKERPHIGTDWYEMRDEEQHSAPAVSA